MASAGAGRGPIMVILGWRFVLGGGASHWGNRTYRTYETYTEWLVAFLMGLVCLAGAGCTNVVFMITFSRSRAGSGSLAVRRRFFPWLSSLAAVGFSLEGRFLR